MNEREIQALRAMESRVDKAQEKLDQEKRALEYLHETGNDRAAKRAEANIARMEKTVQGFREDLQKTLGI